MKREHIKWIVIAVILMGLIAWFAVWLSHQEMI